MKKTWGCQMYFSFSFKPYVAIIGDLKQSRDISDRYVVQEKLNNVLGDINESYSKDLSSKFTITLGDEFQGLLNCGVNAMRITSEIQRRMYPVKIRFGIGIGSITTGINSEMAIGADGPGYYKAREAVEYLRVIEKRNGTQAADIRFEADGDNQGIVSMLNTILTLMTVIKESWSDRQREVIEDILEHQDSQTNTAKRLQIRQPTVHRILANGNYYAYREAFDTLEKALEEITQDVL
ncbi:SatD family protein [Diplocloster agilis]|uniref:SatD family protein n=1 Tax=Diplocloster agilis TaxID=2850323 RepID=UPI001EE964D4